MDPEKHFDHLEKLLRLEEAEEINEFRQEFLKRTPEERELAGKALLRLKIEEFHFSPAGHNLVSFRYEIPKPLPLYSPDIGDLVSLSQDAEVLEDLPVGTVYEKRAGTITVAFNNELPEWVHEEGVYFLNIAGNRATYKKMQEALNLVRSAKHSRPSFFRDLSLGLKLPESFDPLEPKDITFFNPNLNKWQQRAAAKALAAKDIALIHGPPGTGKTTVLIEVIRQAIGQAQFVFATAPSNTACDNLLECLVASGVPALRLGHPARIMRHLREHTLDFKLAYHPLAKTVDQLEHELHRLFLKRERHRDRRALSRGEREEMAEEIRRLKLEIRELDTQIFSQVVLQAPVMIGTHTSAADPILKGKTFDLLVIDEATQGTEPSTWIPLLRAHKAVLAGDHFQLPPTVRSKKAEEQGLGRTLFERFHEILGEEQKALLRIQYRMHEKIMSFSSHEFYGGRLIADESVKNHTLADLKHVQRGRETEEVFRYVDTAGRGFEEELEPGSESRSNREEANLVLDHLNRLLQSGVLAREIALISPYSAQVRLLSSLASDPELEVDSVDGFQGREKEVVILSLVRSNVEGEMGFLTDTRRMNVAMTRAKRKLIVIGDSATLAHIPFYRDFIQYAESIGAYHSVWEEI